MNEKDDTFQTIRWGLRKYAWVIVLLAVNAGVMLPLLRAQSPDVYEATALVSPRGQLVVQTYDALPKYGENIFQNGAVADQVRKDLDLSPGATVIPKYAEVVAEQDSFLFPVIGRGESAQQAQMVANNAAVIFAVELSSSDEAGTFFVQHEAPLPSAAVPEFGGSLSLVLAPLAGAVLGLGLVLLLLIWRQPVLNSAAATRTTGAPVLGYVRLPRNRQTASGGDALGNVGLARRLLSGPHDLILFSSSQSDTADRHQLVAMLTKVLERGRRVRLVPGDAVKLSDLDESTPVSGDQRSPGRQPSRPELVLINGPSPEVRALRPASALMVLVASEGVSATAMRRAAEEYLDGAPMGVVLVKRESRTLSIGRRSRKKSAPPLLDDRAGPSASGSGEEGGSSPDPGYDNQDRLSIFDSGDEEKPLQTRS